MYRVSLMYRVSEPVKIFDQFPNRPANYRPDGLKKIVVGIFDNITSYNMPDILKYENNEVEDKIILIRNQHVIIDSDVAELYGVGTKEINQAVRNNPEKFPAGYIFEIDNKEFAVLRSKFLTTNFSKTRVLPKAFTEKGLYHVET